MKPLPIAIALLAPLLTAAGDAPAEADRIKGIWSALSVTIDGVRQPDDPTRGPVQIAFDGSSYLQRQGEKIVEEGDYEIGSGGEAGAIDLVISRGEFAGKRQLGVYRLSGNELTVCIAQPGARSRPKDFKAGAGRALVVLKRYRP